MLDEFPPSTEAELCAKSDRAHEGVTHDAELVGAGSQHILTHRIAELTETKGTTQMLERLVNILRIVNPGEQQLRLETLDQVTRRITVAETRTAATAGEPRNGDSKQYETRVTVGATTLTVISPCKLSAQAEHETRTLARVAALQIELNAHKPWPLDQAGTRAVNSAAGDGARGAKISYRIKMEREIERLAASPFNVLLTGETGTGKTTIAKEIHDRSARAKKQFLDFNCAALPEHLAEAELFGYKKGAFTGATSDHPGLFEAAIGSTLLLDEVGDLSSAIQSKLLKAIEERKVRRIGENFDRPCDVRIIAATARDLPEMMRRGLFREDLYYRLATLNMRTLPLRERKDEIPDLINTFLTEAARAKEALTGVRPEYRVESRGVELMRGFDWYGNIRVLRNVVLELTSYLTGEQLTISGEAVRVQLARLAGQHKASGDIEAAMRVPVMDAGDSTASAAMEKPNENGLSGVTPEKEETFYSDSTLNNPAATRDVLATFGITIEDGDIILPLEACVVRRKETLEQWIARAELSCIETARAVCGRWRVVAERLGAAKSTIEGRPRILMTKIAKTI